MDIKSLQLFLLVVRLGSFSEAGRRLDRVPSSVSRQVTQLEESLGVVLFHRTTRSLALTEAGRVFETHCKSILSEIEEARMAVLDLERTPSGTLRITAPMSLGRLHIAPAVLQFMDLWPSIRIELDLTDRMVDLIERDVDVAIRVGQLTDSSMVARKLGQIRRSVYASPDYLERAGTPTHPDELEDHDCLTFQPYELSPLWRESSELWRFKKEGKILDIPVDGPFKSNIAETIIRATVAGRGLMLMLDWVVAEQLADGRLVRLFTDYEAAPSDGDAGAYAIYPSGRRASAKVGAFVDFLQQYFQQHLSA